jgi:protein-S-isoprenylcysteine O-methyltransferase Ste14
MDWRHWLDLLRYGMGCLLVIALPPAVTYWFIVHPFIGFWRRMGPRKTFWALAAFFLGTVAALFPVRDALLGRDLGPRLPLVLLGVPLLVVSITISRKRRRYLTFKTLAGVPEISPDKHGIGLLTEGIYGKIRHPRYVEFTLGIVGWALICNYAGLYVVGALTIVAIGLIVLMEERELRDRFGPAYAEYAARVPRFIPRR